MSAYENTVSVEHIGIHQFGPAAFYIQSEFLDANRICIGGIFSHSLISDAPLSNWEPFFLRVKWHVREINNQFVNRSPQIHVDISDIVR